jgi:hypothetical protein
MTRRELLIAKLVALAAGTPYPGEARVAIRRAQLLSNIWWKNGPVINGTQMWALGCDAPGDWEVRMVNLLYPSQTWPSLLSTDRGCKERQDLARMPGEIMHVEVQLIAAEEVLKTERFFVR